MRFGMMIGWLQQQLYTFFDKTYKNALAKIAYLHTLYANYY